MLRGNFTTGLCMSCLVKVDGTQMRLVAMVSTMVGFSSAGVSMRGGSGAEVGTTKISTIQVAIQ